jgi:hypothetical protein
MAGMKMPERSVRLQTLFAIEEFSRTAAFIILSHWKVHTDLIP